MQYVMFFWVEFEWILGNLLTITHDLIGWRMTHPATAPNLRNHEARDMAGRKVGWTWTRTRWGRVVFSWNISVLSVKEQKLPFHLILLVFVPYSNLYILEVYGAIIVRFKPVLMAFPSWFPGGLGPGRLAGDEAEMTILCDWLLRGKVESWKGFTLEFS